MPYISKVQREKYQEILSSLTKILNSTKQTDGELNYFITKLLLEIYKPPNYFNYNRAIGVLECIKQEFYRKAVAKYEDKKALENGDIFE